MPPIVIRDATSRELPDAGAVAAPMGEPVARLKCWEALTDKEKKIEVGVWECSPGIWRRQVLQAEVCHFLAGRAIFTPDGGEAVEIRAGNSVYFPANTKGIWNIQETVRKTYVVFGD